MVRLLREPLHKIITSPHSQPVATTSKSAGAPFRGIARDGIDGISQEVSAPGLLSKR